MEIYFRFLENWNHVLIILIFFLTKASGKLPLTTIVDVLSFLWLLFRIACGKVAWKMVGGWVWYCTEVKCSHFIFSSRTIFFFWLALWLYLATFAKRNTIYDYFEDTHIRHLKSTRTERYGYNVFHCCGVSLESN